MKKIIKLEVICNICKKIFYKYPKSNQKLCSRYCSNIFQKGIKKPKLSFSMKKAYQEGMRFSPFKKNHKINVGKKWIKIERKNIVCLYCDIIFEVYINSKRKYCSMFCSSKQRIGKKRDSMKQEQKQKIQKTVLQRWIIYKIWSD